MLKVYSLFSMIRYNYGTNKLTGAILQGYVDRKYYIFPERTMLLYPYPYEHVSVVRYIKR